MVCAAFWEGYLGWILSAFWHDTLCSMVYFNCILTNFKAYILKKKSTYFMELHVVRVNHFFGSECFYARISFINSALDGNHWRRSESDRLSSGAHYSVIPVGIELAQFTTTAPVLPLPYKLCLLIVGNAELTNIYAYYHDYLHEH